MSSPAFGALYGGYKYESPEARALGSITTTSYDYRDQGKFMSKMAGDVSYMAAYMRKMQKGIDDANQNIIQQIQGLIEEIIVLFGGGGDTGFDFGDLKYILQAFGAFFGFQPGMQLPINLFGAAWHFFFNYIVPLQDFKELFDTLIDASIATMLDMFGEAPIVGQAVQQLAVILSTLRDQVDPWLDLLGNMSAALGNPNVDPTLWNAFWNNFGPVWNLLVSMFGPYVGPLAAGAISTIQFVLSWTAPFTEELTNSVMGWTNLIENLQLSDKTIAQIGQWWANLNLLINGAVTTATDFNPVAAWEQIANNLLNAAGIGAQWNDLYQAITGQFSASPLAGLASLINNGLFGPINFNRIPLVSTAAIQATTPNLLQDSGFNGNVYDPTDVWTKDFTEGHSQTPCAKASPNGQNLVLDSELIGVTLAQQMPINVWVKWIGTTAPLNCNGLQLKIVAYKDDGYGGHIEQSETVIAQVETPNGDSSSLDPNDNDFVQLQGNYTVPANVNSVALRFHITSDVTGGTVKVDDGSLAITGLIQQNLIQDLASKLLEYATNFVGIWNTVAAAGLEDWQVFWNKFFSLFGSTGSMIEFIEMIDDGTVWQNIVNLFIDPLGFFATTLTTDNINSVLNQIGGIFNDDVIVPINGVVTQMQNWYTYFQGFNTAVNNFFQNFINTIVGVMSGIPIVGGTLAAQAQSALTGAFQTLTNFLHVGLTGMTPAAATMDDVQARLTDFRGNVATMNTQISSVQEQLQQTILGKSFGGAPGTDTTTGFGSDWTVDNPTWVKVTIANHVGYQLIPSGTAARTVVAMHNGGPTLTDSQSGRIMFMNMMWHSPVAGNEFRFRADSKTNPQNYIYLRFYYDHVELGYCKAGVRHSWTTWTLAPSFGVVYRLDVGSGTSDYDFSFFQNDLQIGSTFTDTPHDSQKGSGFRESGMVFYSDARTTEIQPASVQYWKMQDNLASGVLGSQFKVSRANTVAVNFAAGSFAIPANFYDTVDKKSADWTIDLSTNQYTCQNAGIYNFYLDLPFLNASGQYVANPNAVTALLAVDGTLVDCADTTQSGAPGLWAAFPGIQCAAGAQVQPVYSTGTAVSISGGSGAQTNIYGGMKQTFRGLKVA